MRCLISTLVFAVVLFWPNEAKAQQSYDVCSISNIPTNFVVTNISGSYGACGRPLSDLGYTYTITNTAGLRTLAACQSTNLPVGWVISDISGSYGVCGRPLSDLGYTYMITNTVGLSSLYVCQSANYPAGWVISSITSSFGVCGAPLVVARSIYTIINTNPTQTIVFNQIPTQYLGMPSSTIVASASSGLPVSFSSLTTSVCTVSGGTTTNGSTIATLSTVAHGTCSITAVQPGSLNYIAAPAVTRSFTVADPTTAIISQSLTSTVSGSPYVVSWSSTNSTTCAIDASKNGETPVVIFTGLNGSQTVSPSVIGTHVWRNICQGPGGTATSTFTHTVLAPAIMTSSISQSLDSTVAGSPYSVTWSSANATSCAVDASRNGETPVVIFTGLSGSQTVSPNVIGTHVWRNICQGPSGSSTSAFTHTVTPAVTSSISQSLTSTVSGSPYTITWSSTDATSCTLDASRNGEIPIVIFTGLSGSQTVSPGVVGAHVWRNICQGPAGPATSTFTHTVTLI